MDSKDPTTYSVLTYLWVVALAAWGGVVNYTRKVRAGEAPRFSAMELVGEIFTAGFVGLLTFLLCEAAALNKLVSAALVGIAGHMGSRAIFMMERWAQRRFGP